MKRLIAVVFLLNFTLSYSQYTAQDRAEKTVKEHLIKTYTKEKYKSFGFEELYKTSPSEILEVEKIKNKVNELRKNNLLTDSSLKYYDSLTSYKVNEVKKKKLYSTYDIKHYFVIEESPEKNSLNFYNFELFPNGKLKDLEQLMKFNFVGSEYDWFYSYYRRSTIVPNDMEENNNCYAYLDNLVLDDTKDREATMATVVAIHATISRYSFLDTVVLPRIIAQNWLRRNIDKEIKVLEYSKTDNILEGNSKIGSNLFVRYELLGVQYAYYFEFDINYILRGNLIVEKPFNQYFKKKNVNE